MAEHSDRNGWHDPGHIDHWEDMLPEERQFERKNSPVGSPPGGGRLILVLAVLYWVVNTLASCRNG